jgi:hypothetical protein
LIVDGKIEEVEWFEEAVEEVERFEEVEWFEVLNYHIDEV